MDKYKLCRVDYTQSSWVRPINEDGRDEGYTLTEFGDDGAYYYAIYENVGDKDHEDWAEWGYYEDDLAKAVEAFNKLKGK